MTTPKPDKCPLFRLSPELRLMIYEKLLVRASRPLAFIKGPEDVVESFDGNNICTSILRTCWAIYNEALPTLYGNNTLIFDTSPVNGLRYFPEHCLGLLKHVRITATPVEGRNSLETAHCLQSLAKLSLEDLTIYIFIPFTEYEDYPSKSPPPVPKRFKSDLQVADNPILPALLSLTSVKWLHILLEDGARFKPGFAKMLEERFAMEGSREGGWIFIEQACTHTGATTSIMGSLANYKIEGGARCSTCGNTKAEIANGTADLAYEDNEVLDKAIVKWHDTSQVLARYAAQQLRWSPDLTIRTTGVEP